MSEEIYPGRGSPTSYSDTQEIRPLRWAASLITGTTPSGPKERNFSDSGKIGWVTPEDLKSPVKPTRYLNDHGMEQARVVPAGSTLVCGIGSIGKLGFSDISLTTNQQITAAVPYSGVAPRYLYYTLMAEQPQIISEAVVTTLPIINNTRLGEVKVRIPSLETQRRIADYLERETSQIDAMLDKLISLEIQLRDRKSALSSSFFVQDFKQVKLKWLLEEVDDRAGKRSRELPLLSVSIHHGVQLRDGSLTNQSPSDNLSHYKVAKPGQIVLNRMRAFQGGLGVSKWHGLVSPDYSVLQTRDELTPGWAEFMMRTPEFVSIMTQALRGIGGVDQGNVRTPRINVRDLLELPIPAPPLGEQRRIADHLDDVTSKIDAMLAKVAQLKDLLTERRAALITDVVTGRKDVA